MLLSFLLLRLATLSFAEIHNVQVGQGGLQFTPDAIAANPGDQVVFTFVQKNHCKSGLLDLCLLTASAVTQSSFAS